jgi:DNA-binding beta-propeller fold protein YncE
MPSIRRQSDGCNDPAWAQAARRDHWKAPLMFGTSRIRSHSARGVLGRLGFLGLALGSYFALAGAPVGATSQPPSSAPTPAPVTWDPMLIASDSASPARVPSPAAGLLPDGRQLTPYGAQIGLGNFPTGGALTADGRFLWTVSAGVGSNDVRIVDTAHRRVCQILAVPGASGGIALDSRDRRAYVSGLANSLWQPSRSTLPGAAGNDVLVFSWTPACGHARLVRVIPIAPPPHAPTLQAFPVAAAGKTSSWPEQVAVSPDGTRLLVALNLADSAAVIDLDHSDQVHYVPMGSGSYPFGAAVLPGGRTGLVSNEATGTLAVVDLRSATRLALIKAGPPVSHPQGIAIDRTGGRAYVALSATDAVAVVNLRRRRVVRTISVARSAGLGTMPVAVTLAPNGQRLFVAESGADEISVIRVPSRGTRRALDWTIVGRIPTADEPEAVLSSAGPGTQAARLMWIAARGLDVGPNPAGPNPTRVSDPIFWAFHPIPPPTVDIFDVGVTYLAALIDGRAGIMAVPSDAHIRQLTASASRQLQPVGVDTPPAHTPLRAGGPITHVFYVVRENRSYDQMLGALGRGDGEPALQVFGKTVTPNMHALLARFPLLDNVMANSDASIQGHYWTSAASVPDYVSRNWLPYYAARFRPADFGMYAVTRPAGGFLFDQAEREHISYFNYGELFGGVGTIPDRDRSAAQLTELNRVSAHSDLGSADRLTPGGCYPAAATIGVALDNREIFDSSLPAGAPAGSYSRIDCFRRRFTRQLANHDVPALNYIIFSSDHTRGTQAGFPTPSAMVADNDQALGQLVDTISHSRIWSSSVIFVVEDDSQDGADHVDAHRIPALVISPYARRRVVIGNRYDLASVIRSVELILGMKPLGLSDALATPMYGVFSRTPVNGAPVNNVPARVDLLTRNTAASADAQLSNGLPLAKPDHVPQQQLDTILWQSVYGANSAPPAPGPNGSANDQ